MKAFLWTSWRRAIGLFYHNTLEDQLFLGYGSSLDLQTLLDGLDILEEVSKWTQPSNEQENPPNYMCMWALNLLKSNKSFIGQDYRRFFERFRETFSNQMPRCVNTSLGNNDLQSTPPGEVPQAVWNGDTESVCSCDQLQRELSKTILG